MSKNTKKNNGFTVTSNHPLRDPNLSNAARGLLCTMKSLPPNWNFTIRGLAVICHDGVDAIRSQISELEKLGYLIRTRKRNEKGHFSEMEYQIVDNPIMVFPTQDAPVEENPTEINKDQQNKEKRNLDESSFPSCLPSCGAPFCGSIRRAETKRTESISRDHSAYREIIKENISYDQLVSEYPFDRDRVDEMLELIVETVCSTKEFIRVAGSDYPGEFVRSRFMALDMEHIKFVFDCLRENTTRIRNIKQYLLTTLFNAPTTMGNYYSQLVQHDLCMGG